MPSRHRFFPLVACLLATGCGGAPVPPDPPPSVAPVKVPVAAPTPPAAAPVASPTSLPTPPPLAEPLPALTRSFVSVTLPGIQRTINAISGRGPDDIWFLTREEIVDFARTVGGEIFQYDGKRVKAHGHPCAASIFGDLVVGKDAVVAMGYLPWSRGVYPYFRASLDRNGTWNCDEDHGGYPTGLTRSDGEHVWELGCFGDNCRLEASGGPAVSVPSYHVTFAGRGESQPPPISALWMQGLDDGWMVHEDDDRRRRLVRYNGVTWVPVAVLDADLFAVDMWADEDDHVWLTARRGGDDSDPANTLLRFDGQKLSIVAVPPKFTTRKVRGTGARDVWFTGDGKKLYQWDGEQLRAGEAPFAVDELWAAPGGEVWFSGPEPSEGGPPPGVVAHTVPLPGKSPAPAAATVKQ